MAETYNPDRLDQLGARRTQLRAELEKLNKLRAEVRAQLDATTAELDAEILTAVAEGIPQADIVRRTRLARESVSQKMRPDGPQWRRTPHNTRPPAGL